MTSTLPSMPSLNAATGMSSSRARAWSATQSASSGRTPSTPAVSCTVIAVTTESGWQPRLARVKMSACSPAPPVGSEAANVSTIGGDRLAAGATGMNVPTRPWYFGSEPLELIWFNSIRRDTVPDAGARGHIRFDTVPRHTRMGT
jgi:hypothetical protein